MAVKSRARKAPKDTRGIRKAGKVIAKASSKASSRATRKPVVKTERVTLKAFTAGQRVRVVVGQLAGRTGKVVRCCVNDSSAWVTVDGGLPSGLRTFPSNDTRRDHILLLPSWCEDASKGEASAK